MWPFNHKNHIITFKCKLKKETKKEIVKFLYLFKYKRKNLALRYVTSKTMVSYERKRKYLLINVTYVTIHHHIQCTGAQMHKCLCYNPPQLMYDILLGFCCSICLGWSFYYLIIIFLDQWPLECLVTMYLNSTSR